MLRFFLFIFLIIVLACNKSERESFSHTNKIGSSAKDFILDQRYTSLHIEIDYVIGHAPSQESITALKSFLVQTLNKPEGIIIDLDDEISPLTTTYTPSNLLFLEEQNRDIFTEGRTIAAYFIILNGKLGDSKAGGSNYYNTSAVLFPEQLKFVSDTLENATLNDLVSVSFIHEFGHMIGLVDLGTPMVQDHSYFNVPGHCSIESCILWPVINENTVNSYLENPDTFGLGEFCLQDLRAIGGK